MGITLSKKEKRILELLTIHGEMHGLEIVKGSNGVLKRGTVYITLGRMADKGFVKSRLDERRVSPCPRRLYKASESGWKVLQEWESIEGYQGWVLLTTDFQRSIICE